MTVVTADGVAFEKYDAYKGGIELHLQDGGRTLKMLPASPEQGEPRVESVREASLRLAQRDRNRMSGLVKYRRDAGLTQADVAKRLGVTTRWVRRIESYDNDPRLSEIRRYAVAIAGEGNAS